MNFCLTPKIRFPWKLTVQTEVRHSLKMRVVIGQFQTTVQRAEEDFEDLNFYCPLSV